MDVIGELQGLASSDKIVHFDSLFQRFFPTLFILKSIPGTQLVLP